MGPARRRGAGLQEPEHALGTGAYAAPRRASRAPPPGCKRAIRGAVGPVWQPAVKVCLVYTLTVIPQLTPRDQWIGSKVAIFLSTVLTRLSPALRFSVGVEQWPGTAVHSFRVDSGTGRMAAAASRRSFPGSRPLGGSLARTRLRAVAGAPLSSRVGRSPRCRQDDEPRMTVRPAGPGPHRTRESKWGCSFRCGFDAARA